jgi:FhuF 2Fe-2S C-terminal domain
VETSPATRASAGQVRSAAAAAWRLGPFFRLEIQDGDPGPGWSPAPEFYRDGLAGLAANTARRLRTGEPRVAASILHQGIAARLWSPVLGCALQGGVILDLSSLIVAAGPPTRIGLARPDGWLVPAPGQLADAVAAAAGPQLAALATALPAPLATGLLRGNSASAMIGALGEVTRAQPELAEPAARLAVALLRTPGLAGGSLDGPGGSFRRRSCCLYYRVPGSGLCGDCCFDAPPAGR